MVFYELVNVGFCVFSRFIRDFGCSFSLGLTLVVWLVPKGWINVMKYEIWTVLGGGIFLVHL